MSSVPLRHARQLDLSERDRAVLVTLASFRLMTGRQLARLFFAGDLGQSANARIARRTFQRLHEQGLVERLERRVGGLRAGSASYVYALSVPGGKAVAAEVRRGRVREPSLAFANHALAISEVAVTLHEARRTGAIDRLRIQSEPDCWRPPPVDDGTWLKPDLHVELNIGPDEFHAFVEIDNGTEHGPAIVRKAEAYEQHYRAGVEQATSGLFPFAVWLARDDNRAASLERTIGRQRLTQALHRYGLQAEPLTAITNNLKGGTL